MTRALGAWAINRTENEVPYLTVQTEKNETEHFIGFQ